MKTKQMLRGFLAAATLLGLTAPAHALTQRDYSHDLVQHQTEMRACMGDHRGDVTVSLVVSGRGRLESSSVGSATSDGMREGGACVLREAQSWQFLRSTSGAHVSYVLTATDRAVQVRRAPRRR
ncbi:MAG: hypothetical protein AB8I08_07885 [Sandaracinaceae bacterium]